MTISQLDDRDWLHRAYVTDGRTQAGIAHELGCGRKVVATRMREHGIEARLGTQPIDHPLLNDPDLLRAAYADDGRTQEDIAAEVGCSGVTVWRRLRAHGIEARTGEGRFEAIAHPLLDSAAALRAAYITDGRTTADIAAEVGCDRSTVSRRLHGHGIQARGRGFPPVHDPLLNDPAPLHQAYVDERRSLSDIADEVGCSTTTVKARIREHGIKARRGAPPIDHPLLNDPELLRAAYADDGRTQSDIAAEVKCSGVTVWRRLRAHGITT